MAPPHGLRRLKVGVAGHQDVDLGFGALDGGADEISQGGVQRSDLPLQPQPHVGGDLVVAAAAGVELACGRADPLGQPALDVAVDVLVARGGERRGRIGCDLVAQRFKPGDNLVTLALPSAIPRGRSRAPRRWSR